MIGFMFAAAVIVLDAMAVLDVFNGPKDAEKKAIWIALILLLPIAGPLLYYLLARRLPTARI